MLVRSASAGDRRSAPRRAGREERERGPARDARLRRGARAPEGGRELVERPAGRTDGDPLGAAGRGRSAPGPVPRGSADGGGELPTRDRKEAPGRALRARRGDRGPPGAGSDGGGAARGGGR